MYLNVYIDTHLHDFGTRRKIKQKKEKKKEEKKERVLS